MSNYEWMKDVEHVCDIKTAVENYKYALEKHKEAESGLKEASLCLEQSIMHEIDPDGISGPSANCDPIEVCVGGMFIRLNPNDYRPDIDSHGVWVIRY